MLIDNFVELGKYVNDCPKCGNGFIGNAKGKLIMDGTYLIRTCMCGFLFFYDEKWGMKKKDIQAAVDRAMRFDEPYTGNIVVSHKGLRRVRMKRGEVLFDMAQKLDIKSSELSSMEHGKTKVPDIILHRLEMIYPELRTEKD